MLSFEQKAELGRRLQQRFGWLGVLAEDVATEVQRALADVDGAEANAEPSLEELHAAFMRVKRSAVVSVELDGFLERYRVTKR